MWEEIDGGEEKKGKGTGEGSASPPGGKRAGTRLAGDVKRDAQAGGG